MKNLLICLMLSISCCWADADQVERLLRSSLRDAPNGEAAQDVNSQIEESTQTLTASEMESILPLAVQCLRSSRLQAQSAGLSMLISLTLRQDSSKLIEPYVETLGNLLNEPSGPFRRGIIAILTLTKPGISPKTMTTLTAHLEDKHSSAEESSGLVWALITADTSNVAIRHKVLNFVTKQSNAEITGSALHALQLVRPPNTEALEFMGKSLDSDIASVRDSAVDVVRGLDREVRTKFAAQLGRIAGDPQEGEELRSRAAAVLRQ
jgi:hypothetical protein